MNVEFAAAHRYQGHGHDADAATPASPFTRRDFLFGFARATPGAHSQRDAGYRDDGVLAGGDGRSDDCLCFGETLQFSYQVFQQVLCRIHDASLVSALWALFDNTRSIVFSLSRLL